MSLSRGGTSGDLGGTNAGGSDAFLAKIIDLTFFSLTGDYNGDGTVDAADYTVWRDAEGTTGTGLAADANGDGFVNSIDYDLWVANFGATTPPPASSPASSTNVPEPSSALLAGVMLTLLGCKRRIS